ncbi:WecB/TagA/CpsF family glycosyltransferase [Rhodococcus sp. NCIMB 12038]|uniref:WecB/TagA/CpsF family glycosyltransferase n=1 Tax=Rhodococcus sp. NCIMB 12038 TaxID=933800 RepID=UPI0015C65733|nr:WecB/TagA/CpsF family glycosyltransferase [Rhodococcus sp. NCIMB 12038]
MWQAKGNPALAQAYQLSNFSPPDGWPVVEALRLLSDVEEIERVTGADLLTKLCELPLVVSFVGGRANSAELAATRLCQKNSQLRIGVVEKAPPGELTDVELRTALIRRVVKSDSDIVFVGLGVPKQEQLSIELFQEMDRGVVVCVGAAIEFAAGTLQRAPEWYAKTRLEWLHRLSSEPRKLALRYILSAPYFLRIVAQEMYKLR